jgi:dTDP-4-amino-4,6-dideoxygalactose transaminase
MIQVNKPFLPKKEAYNQLISKIWDNKWLTNSGPYSVELEDRLKKRIGVEHLLFVSSGTMALQLSIAALELKGEVITTPFSFIATTTSIIWQNCTPVFVDIDRDTLNIDASKIEESITVNTTAILATHVYGNPCDIELIQRIADKHDLKVIYDGAHAFDVKYKHDSVFKFGDISICSLHASKLYHSTEGGFIALNNYKTAAKIARIRNFGFTSPTTFKELGINGKNSEFHAAMGLANYPHIEGIIAKRKLLTEEYDYLLKNLNICKPVWNNRATKNYAYYPLIFSEEKDMLQLMEFLQNKEIFTRRYFYPSLANSLDFLPKQSLEVTDNIAKRVLCLPLYYDLSLEDVGTICKLINEFYLLKPSFAK